MPQSRTKSSKKASSKGSTKAKKKEAKKPSNGEFNGGSKWVIVELSHAGEKEKDLNSIRRSARKILKSKDIDIFIPAITQVVREESHILAYMEGYIFILYDESISYLRLQETVYFKSVLTRPVVYNRYRNRQILSLLSDRELNPMRDGVERLNVRDFSPGEQIKIIKGNYRNLKAEVIQVYEDKKLVQVYVSLKSKQILLDFPSSYLERIPVKQANA